MFKPNSMKILLVSMQKSMDGKLIMVIRDSEDIQLDPPAMDAHFVFSIRFSSTLVITLFKNHYTNLFSCRMLPS